VVKNLRDRWVRVKSRPPQDLFAYVPARHFLIGYGYSEIVEWCEQYLTPKKWRIDYQELSAYFEGVGFGTEQFVMIEIDTDTDIVYYILRWE
jgi:hypothetical protein